MQERDTTLCGGAGCAGVGLLDGKDYWNTQPLQTVAMNMAVIIGDGWRKAQNTYGVGLPGACENVIK